jgi:hypothetical protein
MQAEALAGARQRLQASQELQQQAAAALVAISNQMVQGAGSVCTGGHTPLCLLAHAASSNSWMLIMINGAHAPWRYQPEP